MNASHTRLNPFVLMRDPDALIDAETFMDAGSEGYRAAQPALQLAVH